MCPETVTGIVTGDAPVSYTPLQHSHNAPYFRPAPQILHKHCFPFLFGRLLYPGEMKNIGYAKFGVGGQIGCFMGNVEVAYWPLFF